MRYEILYLIQRANVDTVTVCVVVFSARLHCCQQYEDSRLIGSILRMAGQVSGRQEFWLSLVRCTDFILLSQVLTVFSTWRCQGRFSVSFTPEYGLEMRT